MNTEQNLSNENPAQEPLPQAYPAYDGLPPSPPPPPQPKPKDVVPVKHSWLLFLMAFVLALGIDLLIFEQSSGKQFAIIVNAILLGAVVLSLAEKRKIPWQSWPLMAMIALSSLLTIFRVEPFTVAALIIFVVFALPLLLMSMFSGQWAVYRIREYFKRYFFITAHGVIGFPRAIVEGVRTQRNPGQRKKVFSIIGAIILGVIIAIPILLLFGKLLSSADSTFAKNIEAFLNFFKFDSVEAFWPQFFIVLFFFWGLAGLLFYMLSRSHRVEPVEPDKALLDPFLPNLTAIIVLALINLMFLLFIIGQWHIFFGGIANVREGAYNFSSYAVEGFNQLMVVASIAAVLHYLFASVTKRESRKERVTFSITATLLLAQVGLILVSAFKRLLMYETAYGFTRSRMVAHVFMVFLALLLVALAAMELSKNLKRLALVLVVSVFLFGITLWTVNVDKTITRLNIEQATLVLTEWSSARLDGSYLAVSVSEDAVPELYKNYLNPEHSAEMRENLGKILACRALRVEKYDPPGKWYTYTVPEKAEYDFFAEHGKSLIESYPPEKEDSHFGYILGYTIDGEFVDCVRHWEKKD